MTMFIPRSVLINLPSAIVAGLFFFLSSTTPPAVNGQPLAVLEGIELPNYLSFLDFVRKVRQTDAEEEYGESKNLTLEVINRFWEANVRHDWRRAVSYETLNQRAFPFLFCKENEAGEPGYVLQQSLRDELVNATSVETLLNGEQFYCAFTRVLAEEALGFVGTDWKVTPVMSAMKVMRASIENLESELAKDTEITFLDILLCSGEHATPTITNQVTDRITTRPNENQDVLLASELAWWRSARVDPNSTISAEPTPREQFWEDVIASNLTVCNETYTDHVIWEISEEDSRMIRLGLNKTGANIVDKICAYVLLATLMVRTEVCTVETVRSPNASNHRAQWLVQTGVEEERPWFDAGLKGQGQIVTVSDTGVDTDNCYFGDAIHDVNGLGVRNNEHRKIVEYKTFAYADFGDYKYGHGTHVVGTVLGQRSDDGITATDGMADGVAPEAKVAFADIGSDTGALYTPDDFSLLSVGRKDEPISHIHSASWGVPLVNGYTIQTRNFDRYMFENDDFLMFLAAGNDGEYDGKDTPNTVSTPATCKNGVAVGAAHNCCDQKESGQLGPNHIASFSSRGPTADGRIKPDIVAPGKWILSAGALPKETGECDPKNAPGAGKRSGGVLSLQGTSMATPVAAGHAALIRQYFTEGFYPTGERVEANSLNPSGALIKAVMMNGAQYLSGVDNRGGTTELSPYDNAQGFGRVSLIDSLTLAGKSLVSAQVWDRESLKVGESKVYEVTIDTSKGCTYETLSATLVWMEPASVPGCLKCLRNNLDLSVKKNGDSKIYYPNGREDSADEVNNAERVQVDAADKDVFTLEVNAADLTDENQSYALVATGCFGGIATDVKVANDVYDNDDSESKRRNRIIGIVCGVGGALLICAGVVFWQKRQQAGAKDYYDEKEAVPEEAANDEGNTGEGTNVDEAGNAEDDGADE